MQEERTGIGAGPVKAVLCTKVNQNSNLKRALTIDRYQNHLDYFEMKLLTSMDEETRAGAYAKIHLNPRGKGGKPCNIASYMLPIYKTWVKRGNCR